MAEYNPSKIIKDGNTYNFRDTTKIPLAGSNEISGSLIPSTDGTVNLGSPSYQWNNAYIKSLTINGVAAGDILTHNASEFVDITSAQTIGGVKTFSNGDKTFNDSAPLRIQGHNYGNEFSPNARTVLEFRANRDTTDKSGIYLSKFRQNRAQGEMGVNDSAILTMDVLENGVRTNDLFRFTFKGWLNDVPTKAYLEPYSSGTQTFLGTSSYAWKDVGTKAINGINPGALSLPSGTVGMNLIGDVAVVDAEKKLSKDITVTGFVYVDVSFSSTSSNRLNLYNDTKKYGIWIPCNSGRIRQIMPISSGDRLEFNVLDEGSTVNTIQIFTCQGNV